MGSTPACASNTAAKRSGISARNAPVTVRAPFGLSATSHSASPSAVHCTCTAAGAAVVRSVRDRTATCDTFSTDGPL